MAKQRRHLPPEMVFRVCEMIIANEGATKISQWVREQGFECTREQVYPILQKGIDRGYLKLNPPMEIALSQRLERKFSHVAGHIQVVNVAGQTTHNHVSSAAADLLLSLITEIAAAREGQPVHVGFGAGTTIMRVAQSLAKALLVLPEPPPLALHALSSGFSVDDPTTAPVAFFSYFREIRPAVSYYGLFTPPVVRVSEYEQVKQLPGIRESFTAARDIDIAITSLAYVADEHGLLNTFMDQAPKDKRQKLHDANWVGDVQWRPYSEDGPIMLDTGIRAVTLFELDELATLAATPGKHVILVAAPCSKCGMSKSKALRPLLEQPTLRVSNHLVTDVGTANELMA